MSKSKIFYCLIDIMTICKMRMKLILRDTTTRISLVFSLLIFILIFHILSESAEEYSAIPVGLVDYDKTTESFNLVKGLSQSPSLRIIEDEEKLLHKLLLDEKINALFIIEEGYEENIKKGNPNKLIKVYYISDNKSALILSDIIAGEMIYPISLYKTMDYYKHIPYNGIKHGLEEYKAYIENLKGSDDFDFAFNISFENPEGTFIKESPISNALLYNQLIFGILGILFALIAMFFISFVVRERELGVESRLSITSFNQLKCDFTNLLALLSMEAFMALIFAGLIYMQLKQLGLRVFIGGFLLIFIYAFVQGCMYLIVSAYTKSTLTYQILCSILILIMAGLGFYSLLSGFQEARTASFVKIIPNSWFIQGFTDIIVYDNIGNILNKGHKGLLLTGVVLVTVLFVQKLVQSMKIIKKQD